ncbi:hypothetical protein C8R45DRAFT_1026478 [Mycena sanguinolenta]|nr:hypothetical protein C8R45DRAFT_1026478 [Mycena sanguinolenta]
MFRAAGKRSGRKEIARLRREATEERARLPAAAVSPVNHVPTSYTPPPDNNLLSLLTVPIASLRTVVPGPPSSWADNIPNESWAYDADGERIPTQLAPALSCSPRDWSTLRSGLNSDHSPDHFQKQCSPYHHHPFMPFLWTLPLRFPRRCHTVWWNPVLH